MKSLLDFDPPVIAHRGASGYAPENTLAAFIKAKTLGVKWLEFDVMLTSCGLLVIFHDETLDRTTTRKGLVRDCTYETLATLDVGSWFHQRFANERILTLEQALQFLQQNQLAANVEIKTQIADEELLVEKLLSVVQPYLAQAQTLLFSSFSVPLLYKLHKALPTCYIGLLMHQILPDWENIILDLNCISLHVNQRLLTKSFTEKLRLSEKKILAYTVNNIPRALQLFSWGVDAVFSDYPDKIISAVR